ncbi:MAG: type IV pilin N-terminal domain-containing protein [Methanoregula sp.]
MVYPRSEEAISHIAGVILVIVAVLILAAVVTVVAFSVGGTSGGSKAVAITANKGTTGIVFTVQGGADLKSVTSIDLVSGSSITNCTGSAPKVGQSCTVGTDSDGRTVMVASFADGSKQVVFDKNWGSVIQGTTSSSANDYESITMSVTFDGTNYVYTWVFGPYGPKYYDAVYYYYINGAHIGDMNPGDVPPDTYTETNDIPTYTSYKIVAVVGGEPVATLLDWNAV